MNGIHLIADLFACDTNHPALLAAGELQTLCMAACQEHELEVVAHCFHQFENAGMPAGATGAVVLAESHLAIHTWPELGSVTLDLYVCNFSRDNEARAEAVFATLLAAFSPQRVERQTLRRGTIGF